MKEIVIGLFTIILIVVIISAIFDLFFREKIKNKKQIAREERDEHIAFHDNVKSRLNSLEKMLYRLEDYLEIDYTITTNYQKRNKKENK
jgi:uncharacterized alpha/beta hydrolase family protein